MIKRKKYGNIHFFLQPFGMAHKLPVALNTDMDPSRFDHSTFIILFVASYFIVSK